MYRRFLSICYGTFLFFGIIQGTSAKTEPDFSQMSPTVKITSYIYTKNDGVVPQVQGSGTILSPTGLILTNNHVVERDDERTYDIFEICISFYSEEKPVCDYMASLVARNREMDTAFLQMDSTGIHGNPIPALKYLTYDQNIKLREEDPISIVGFPGIGLDTITFTQGQVSGFEEIRGFPYVKTDTIIAPGNSGGTALDEDGSFVGIPTYGVSTFGSSLGYFLDIREAVPWIEENKGKESDFKPLVHERLAERLRIVNTAKETKVYEHPYSPRLTFKIPEDWEYQRLDRYALFAASKDEVKNYSVNIVLEDFPFELTDEYLEEVLFKKLERNKDDHYKSYKRELTEFQGVPAYLVTHLFLDNKSYNYIIPYGGTLILISYEYDLKDQEEGARVYESVLKNLVFQDEPQIPSMRTELKRKTPSFSIATPSGWYLQENMDPRDEDLISTFLRPDDPEGQMIISHFELSESDRQLPNDEFLQNILKNHEDTQEFRLVSKDENVVIDGLSGVSLTYTYRGEELNQPRKISKVYLRDDDHYYFLRYDDLDKNYDRYLPQFKDLLRSFRNLNEETRQENGEYEIGSLDIVFRDIQYHVYAQAISDLQDKGIISGYQDKTFRPEREVSRSEALKIMLEAKVVADDKRDDFALKNSLEDFTDSEYQNLDFKDTTSIDWLHKYVRYARQNKIISGYADGLFHPRDTVTVAEACKILFALHEIPVWDSSGTIFGNLIPWYKPYMDKGFELGIMPHGVSDAQHKLTRGELAYMIDTLLEKVEE